MLERAQLEELATKVVDAAFEVHQRLGVGLLESAYELALCHELHLRGIKFEPQALIRIQYKGIVLGSGFRCDILVEDEIILEIKSVDALAAQHEAQLINYLRLSERGLGFLINFNVVMFSKGIKRRVVNLN